METLDSKIDGVQTQRGAGGIETHMASGTGRLAMHQDEFDAFGNTLKQLGEAFNRKLSDELTQAYWKALKDLPFQAISRMADSHMRYGKFFPKPSELRPKDAPPERKPDPDFESGVQKNIENWEERLRLDPIGARSQLLTAYVARIEVTEKPGSPIWHERMEFARRARFKIDAMKQSLRHEKMRELEHVS